MHRLRWFFHILGSAWSPRFSRQIAAAYQHLACRELPGFQSALYRAMAQYFSAHNKASYATIRFWQPPEDARRLCKLRPGYTVHLYDLPLSWLALWEMVPYFSRAYLQNLLIGYFWLPNYRNG
jgi:hypothetical protein